MWRTGSRSWAPHVVVEHTRSLGTRCAPNWKGTLMQHAPICCFLTATGFGGKGFCALSCYFSLAVSNYTLYGTIRPRGRAGLPCRQRKNVRVVRRGPSPRVDSCRGELRTGSRYLWLSSFSRCNFRRRYIARLSVGDPFVGSFLHKRASDTPREMLLFETVPKSNLASCTPQCACAALSIPGIFGRKGACQPMLCCISLGGEGSEIILTGATSGHLYVWEGRNCTRCIKAHTGAIMTMTRCG